LLLLADLQAESGIFPGGIFESPEYAEPLRVTHPADRSVYHLSTVLALAAQRLLIQASAPSGATDVTLWLDGSPLARFTAPPYETWWPLEAGEHEAWVSAVTAAGEPLESPHARFTVPSPED
jgi:hypothetical protein